jgi:3-methyladenine DNA glycosylase AlkD
VAADQPLVAAVRAGLRAAADPAKAPRMQAYMKSELPFLGVYAPELRRVCGAVFDVQPVEDWRRAVLELWHEAEYREERYAALALLHRHRRKADLELLEELIVSGSWWDYVDPLSQVLGELLRRRPDVEPVVRAWSRDSDPWKRRAAILCQLKFRSDTDAVLLRDCIEANLGDDEFFIRKAIGWALREYAKTDPEWVVRFVREHDDRLSPLSRREALKRIG